MQPGVWEFIANTYLAHASEVPDSNEAVEVLRLYLEGNNLLWQGQVEQALDVFSQAAQIQPDSRHAHAGLGYALSTKYLQSQDEAELRASVQHLIEASEIGMEFGRLHYTRAIAYRLARLDDKEELYAFFSKALASGYEPYAAHLHFAEGLAQLGDPAADEWFQKAISLQSSGVVDALAAYTEWLLERGQWNRVLEIIPSTESSAYLLLLRGVALERRGQIDQARQAYAHYAPLSAFLPVPARYRIEGSVAQKQLYF